MQYNQLLICTQFYTCQNANNISRRNFMLLVTCLYYLYIYFRLNFSCVILTISARYSVNVGLNTLITTKKSHEPVMKIKTFLFKVHIVCHQLLRMMVNLMVQILLPCSMLLHIMFTNYKNTLHTLLNKLSSNTGIRMEKFNKASVGMQKHNSQLYSNI